MARVDQRFFLLRTDDFSLSASGWTEEEQRVLAEHRWWSIQDIRNSSQTIWPDDLADIVDGLQTMGS